MKSAKNRTVEIQPSVLEVPHDKLHEALKSTNGHVRTIHMDVMDGRFVPRDTRSIQPPALVSRLAEHGLRASVHLMTRQPLRHALEYAKAGAHEVIFHVEATSVPHQVIAKIREAHPQVKIGLSLNPRTSVERVKPFLKMIDFVLVMTVQPGLGGQKFKEFCLQKVRVLKKSGTKVRVGIDGGAKTHTVPAIVRAGADSFVAGTAVYNPTGTPAQNIRALQSAIRSS